MGELEVEVVMVHGSPDPMTKAYAKRKIGQLGRLAPAPVLSARVKLDRAPDPALDRPVVAQGMLDLNGRPVFAQVAARRLDEAVDLLEERLRDRLEHLAGHLLARRRAATAAEPGEWRHGHAGSRRPDWFPRPLEERAVVRHPPLALTPMTLADATLDLDLLGYDFYLFVEAETGCDALVWRLPGDGLGVAVAGGRPPELAASPETVRRAQPPPRLAVRQATRWLDLTDEPFLFFVDSATGRGSVAYRRRDGHYGLIAPA